MKKHKYEHIQKVFGLLLTKTPNIKMIEEYFTDVSSFALQDFCVAHLRPDIEWSTGIGLIEAVVHIYDEALNNDNFGFNSPS